MAEAEEELGLYLAVVTSGVQGVGWGAPQERGVEVSKATLVQAVQLATVEGPMEVLGARGAGQGGLSQREGVGL